MERKISNQHLICLLGPNTNRQSVLAIVLNMIWKLEESSITFQIGIPSNTNTKYIQFQVSIFIYKLLYIIILLYIYIIILLLYIIIYIIIKILFNYFLYYIDTSSCSYC